MDQQLRGGSGVGDGEDDWNGSAGAGSQEPRWACPFYKSNPIRHEACVAYKLGRVADIRQHIKRKHAREAKGRINEMESKDGRSKTNEGRWYALWSTLFPGQALPPTPYHTETEFADLLAILAARFMEQQKGEAVSAEVEIALTGFVAFAKTTTLDMKSGQMSSQAVAGVSERQTQSTGIQDNNNNTHKGLPPLTNLSNPSMGSFQQPDARPFFVGYHDTHMSDATTEPQALSISAASGQYWSSQADTATYSPMSAHQLPSFHSMYDATVNGYVDGTVAPSDLAVAMSWGTTDDSGQYGRHKPWGVFENE